MSDGDMCEGCRWVRGKRVPLCHGWACLGVCVAVLVRVQLCASGCDRGCLYVTAGGCAWGLVSQCEAEAVPGGWVSEWWCDSKAGLDPGGVWAAVAEGKGRCVTVSP